ncbi:MAG: phosphosulfolactate synthase, partial [Bacteroidota bacterium]
MNFNLPHLPERDPKPRKNGITMMMDKGLGIKEVENFIDTNAAYTDLVKLGFGTSYLTNRLEDKIKLYHEAGLRVYLGGTLFEAFIIRGLFDEYRKVLDKYKITMAEVSDGSLTMNHDVKCNYIHQLAKDYTVLSE